MNLYAYHPNDSKKAIIHIDTWVVEHGPSVDGRCRICGTYMFVKADKSQKQTHFAHYPNSHCPTVSPNHAPYESFKNLPRDKILAQAAKRWVLTNINGVFEKIRKFVPALTWKEFHSLIEVANSEDIWSLKEMPHDYIPYVLLACTKQFDANKSYNRPNAKFFVLEPSPEPGEFWNSSGLQKKYLWEITLPGKDVKHHEIKLETPESWYIERVRNLLT